MYSAVGGQQGEEEADLNAGETGQDPEENQQLAAMKGTVIVRCRGRSAIQLKYQFLFPLPKFIENVVNRAS